MAAQASQPLAFQDSQAPLQPINFRPEVEDEAAFIAAGGELLLQQFFAALEQPAGAL